MEAHEEAVAVGAPQQFNHPDVIRAHYDVMAELDRDVHDDDELSASEVATALRLTGIVPERVFLPCFGTGRHIPALLEAGVKEIVGVDLSPACVAKARRLFGHLPGVRLEVGDLLTWDSGGRKADAVILLGNSYADCIDLSNLRLITSAMLRPLREGGVYVMDYIGLGYLERCRLGTTSTWDAVLDGHQVRDARTPSFDLATGVMTISVQASLAAPPHAVVWTGSYQKRVLDNTQVRDLFAARGVTMVPAGVATDLNPAYYRGHEGELGMIARSTWWVGVNTNVQ